MIASKVSAKARQAAGRSPRGVRSTAAHSSIRVCATAVEKSDAANCVDRAGPIDVQNQLELSAGRRSLLLASALIPLTAWLTLPDSARADGITVFVAGSTGQSGRRVVQQLRAKGFNVRAGVRDIKKAAGLGYAMDKGVELVEADVLKPEQLAAAIGNASAVICAIGYVGFNPSGFGQVDEVGTKNLIDAAKAAGVTKFILQSSLLTNAVEMGQKENPNFKFLNIFGGVLDHKLAAERYLRASGMTWTIVRPGGLMNEPASEIGNLIVSKEDTLFGLESDPGREISRDTVAEVLVAALDQTTADDKVVEIVSSPSAPVLTTDQCFVSL